MQATAAGLVAAVVALHPIVTPDLWWHLASGRWILEHRSVPRTDVFSYTMSEHEWTNLQWLTDVGMVAIWRAVGPEGLVLLKALVLALTAAVLVRAGAALGAGAAEVGAAACLAVLASAERTLVRPEILTGLLLATTTWLLHRAWRGRERTLWLLPVISVGWANLHALAFLGPATTLLHAGAAFLDRRLPDRWRHAEAPATLPRNLLFAGIGSAVALLANPYGVAAWTFPFTLYRRIGGDVEIFSRILEFARPLDTPQDPALRWWWVLIGFSLASFAALLPRVPPLRLALVVPFLVLALLARRNVPLFAIAAAPVLALNVSQAIRRRPALPRWSRASWAPPIAAVVLTAAILGGASPALLGLWRDRGLSVAPHLFPEECLAALDQSGIRGNIFHDLDFGGYLVWRDPDRKSFIDGRLEVAGPDWFARFVEAHESPAAWRRLQRSWGLEILLLEHSARGNAAFLRALLEDGAWTPLCYSPEAALLVRNPPETSRLPRLRPALEDWDRILAATSGPTPGAGRGLGVLPRFLDWLVAPDVPLATVRGAVRYGNLCLTLGWVDEARAGYERVLGVAPNDPEALFNLGVCDLRDGDERRARARWRDALTRVGRGNRATFREGLERLGAPD